MLECVYIELQYEKFIFLSFEIFICFGLENGCGKSFRVFDQIWRYEMGNNLGHQGKGLNTLKLTYSVSYTKRVELWNLKKRKHYKMLAGQKIQIFWSFRIEVHRENHISAAIRERIPVFVENMQMIRMNRLQSLLWNIATGSIGISYEIIF